MVRPTNLDSLKNRKRAIIASFKRCEEFLKNYDPEEHSFQLKTRLDKVKPLHDQLLECVTEIQLISNDEVYNQTLDEELEDFENRFFSLIGKLESMCKSRSNSPKSSTESIPLSNNNSACKHNLDIRLPQISLPSFNGDFKKWNTFKDNFLSLIHNQPIPNVKKLHYLKSCLKEQASDLISNLATTDNNYKIAWDLVVQRYENKRLISNSHVNSLFQLPSSKSDSLSSLKNLHCEFFKNVRALEALGENVDESSFILVQLLASKFDRNLLKRWEEFVSDQKNSPKITGIETFILKEINILEMSSPLPSSYQNQGSKPFQKQGSSNKTSSDNYKKDYNYSKSKQEVSSYPISNNPTPKSLTVNPSSNSYEPKTESKTYPCYVCQQVHRLYMCPTFLSMTPDKRYEFVQSKQLCLNCFNKNHKAAYCKSTYSCKICSAKHHSLLHKNKDSNQPPAVTCTSSHTFEAQSPNLKNANVLLATALIDIISPDGSITTARALLDSAAQGNFICESLVQKMKLKRIKCDVPVSGLGQSKAQVSHQINIVVKSKINEFRFPISCFVLPKITSSLPQCSFDYSEWNLPPNVRLADPSFNISSPIDLLIGAQYFFDILTQGKIVMSDSLPVLQCTQFGWILSGRYFNETPNPLTSSNNVSFNFLTVSPTDRSSQLDSMLTKFWELELCDTKPKVSREDEWIDQFYENTTEYCNNRYQVRLPFVKDPKCLGNSYDTALKCLFSMEKKFSKNSKLHEMYSEFMSEYITLGHMIELSTDEYKLIFSNPHYFLPHHAVLRDSLTTKLRVVFNGSMVTTTGLSLNDILAVGPQLLNDSFDILLRFRGYLYALIGDVAKMYRQIRIHPLDTAYQLILWRSNPSEPVKIFRLLTVTYGTAPAPFLAIRTTHKLASDFQVSFPNASKRILQDFYCDDLVSGESTVSRLIQLKDELSDIFKLGGMELRKWCSNYPGLEFSSDSEFISLSIDDNVKTLGMSWHPRDDTFQFHIKFPTKELVTKRTIVSDVCRIFDPLGLMGPLVMKAKLFIRTLWLNHLDWDEELPQSLLVEWSNFTDLIHGFSEPSIPRHVCSIKNPIKFELHGFCDASEVGYGACFYLKSYNEETSCVHLLCSKSRVAPTKVQSIPRLELCGALLLSELCQKVTQSLTNIELSSIYLWTDAMIVLHWLASDSCKWKVFVSNRVSKIQELTENYTWLHVSSEDNPADNLSRGNFDNSSKWWHGPSFLSSISDYPNPILSPDCSPPEEKELLVHVEVGSSFELLNLNKFSSWIKLTHVVAYVFRFIKCLKSHVDKNFEKFPVELTPNEIQQAQLKILLLTQFEMFPNEINLISKNKPLPSSCHLLSLSPFLDPNGLLRVGGRLKHSSISSNQKHQILLTSSHPVTLMILNYYHKKTLHSGPQSLLYSVRQVYWPLNGMNTCKKIVRQCTTCFKANPIPAKCIMGNLPEDRVNVSRPFTNTGLDFAGPILIRQSMSRKPTLIKAYICVFVCFSTKAVHLEPVSDLTTTAFLAAVRRFIARRGMIRHIYCDNGKNFVGAKNHLNDMYKFINSKECQSTLISSFNDAGLEWNFIPAKSPAFGGLWEAAVKSSKHHLRRVMGLIHFNFEELCTILAQIEAQLNSRPLTPLSNDPNDLLALSPSHFLVGSQLTTIPDEICVSKKSMSLHNRWHCVQKAQNDFWSRWQREYLGHLQSKTKWRQPYDHVEEGMLVILKDDNLAPLHWPLARITSIHKGSDGVPRVVTLKTKSGETTRSVRNICPLPKDISL